MVGLSKSNKNGINPNTNSAQALNKFNLYLQRKGRSKNTIDAYLRCIQQTFCKTKLETLSQSKLENIALQLMKKYELNSNRIQFAAINIFCREILKRNDLKLKIPKSHKINKDVLITEQVESILEIAKQKRRSHYAVFLLLYDCALRRSEVCNLNLDDVRFESMEIHLNNTKTGANIVNMTSRVAEAIQDYLSQERKPLNIKEKALFVNKHGIRIGEHFIRDSLKRYAVNVGITQRVYPHMLRASCITHMLNKRINPLIVQTHARHRDFQTTMKYNRPTQQQMREEIENCFVGKSEMINQSGRKELLDKFLKGELSGSEFIQLSDNNPKPKQLKPDEGLTGYV